MDRKTSQTNVQTTPAALGGIALLLLLAVAAAVPNSFLHRSELVSGRQEALREPITARAISGAVARAVRDLVGGSTVSAVVNAATALASAEHDAGRPLPPQREGEPTLSTSRPELRDLPPPTGC